MPSIFSQADAARSAMLADLDLWTVPFRANEAALVAEVGKLEFVEIDRLDDATLARWGMNSKNCHANVGNYIDRRRLKSARPVTGWWDIGSGAYVLHSVVATRRGWVCVTPYFDERRLRFAADPRLRPTPKGMTSGFVRDGIAAPPHLRYDYDRVVAECTMIRDRLLAGMDPAQAYLV